MASSSESGRFYCFARHSGRAWRDPESSVVFSGKRWIPAFAGMTLMLEEKKPRLEGRGFVTVRDAQPSRTGT
jgi:hypothetical protein